MKVTADRLKITMTRQDVEDLLFQIRRGRTSGAKRIVVRNDRWDRVDVEIQLNAPQKKADCWVSEADFEDEKT